MPDFALTKWKFRVTLGFLISLAAASWAAISLHAHGIDQTWVIVLADSLPGILTASLLFTAIFVFRPLVHGLARQYRNLEEVEVRSRAVVEAAADGIITFDSHGLIESVNPAAEKLFACTAAEVTGKSIQTIMPGYRGLFEVVDEGESRITGVAHELVGHRWDGSTFDMELRLSELEMPERELSMAVIRDVSSRKEAERRLRESEERFRLLVEHSPDAIAIHSGGKIVFGNSKVPELLGASSMDEILGQPVLKFVLPEHQKTILDRITLMSTRGVGAPPMEERFVRLDGSTVDVEVVAIPFEYKGAQAIQVVARDIRRRKQADLEIRKSLKEKEVLLKEIHHRVKNNLQVITSLLDLQSDYVTDKKALEVLLECQNRVKSISLIHERLYESRDLAHVDFPQYIQLLMDNLLRAYGVSPDRVGLKIDVTDIQLGLDTAIPCGLIIHELVSNCLKHAFPENRTGEIRVGMHQDGDRYFLIVSDNGAGFKGRSDFRTVSNLGLQLVDTLTSQIAGNIDFHTNGGTEFIISFRQ
jgi:PAS domain S-box-containing protein